MRRILITLTIVVLCTQTFGFIVTNPGYQAEEYARYDSIITLAPRDIEFDSQGNLYVSQTDSPDNLNGAIYKITPGGTSVTPYVSNLQSPWHMVKTNSAPYGDNLYVASGRSEKVLKVDSTGSVEIFSSLSDYDDYPFSIAIDTTGNYGGYMYTGSSRGRNIYRIMPDGTNDMFSSFPTGVHDGSGNIALDFDSHGNYGGKMFITVHYNSSNILGLYEIETDGTASKFAPSILGANDFEFDPYGTYFNYKMICQGEYAVERHGVHIVNPNGSVEEIGTHESRSSMTFGLDGALYLSEVIDNDVVITRITPVPEPVTLSLLGLGALLLRKRS